MENEPIIHAHPEDDPVRQMRRDVLVGRLLDILYYAERNGFVVTVETRPLEPLAMRNYCMVADVRAAR